MSAFVENAVVRCCLQPALITSTEGVPEQCATCPHRDTRDLVVSQCTQCEWKSCGFRSAVEIAKTAHVGTHGGFARQAGVPVSVVVPRQASPTQPPRPLSRGYVWAVTVGGTLSCFALAMFTQWLLYHHWHFHSFHGFRWGTSLVMVPAVAMVLRLLMYKEQRRRQAVINRFMVVAEANHHIRNALAVLVAANYLQGEERRKVDRDLPKTYAVIQEAIERIEGTLAEVLPKLNDKD